MPEQHEQPTAIRDAVTAVHHALGVIKDESVRRAEYPLAAAVREAALAVGKWLTEDGKPPAIPSTPPAPAGPYAELRGNGAALIAAERQRQIDAEGWTPEHDDKHRSCELVDAARYYMRAAAGLLRGESLSSIKDNVGLGWPWGASWWKPSRDPIRNLVKAGALIAAEIDRLQRRADAAPPANKPPGDEAVRGGEGDASGQANLDNSPPDAGEPVDRPAGCPADATLWHPVEGQAFKQVPVAVAVTGYQWATPHDGWQWHNGCAGKWFARELEAGVFRPLKPAQPPRGDGLAVRVVRPTWARGLVEFVGLEDSKGRIGFQCIHDNHAGVARDLIIAYGDARAAAERERIVDFMRRKGWPAKADAVAASLDDNKT